MEKRIYNAPTVEQESVMVEAGIATSTTIAIKDDGTHLEDWQEGNTNWW